MKALIISDSEYRTETFQQLERLVHTILSQKGFDIEEARIERDELGYCMGCFGCWIKKPGECVINDKMASINRSFINSDAVFYLSPVVFGQYSCNIKNTLDRWLPNVLPFFITRKDGATMHPPRYKEYPAQIIIGYGEELADDEMKLFSSISKHRASPSILFYQGDDKETAATIKKLALKRHGGDL
jgi:multimeric flavodoxin WrbA